MCGVYSSAPHGKSPESCLDVELERWRRLTFIGQNVTRRYKGADGLKIGLTAPDASPRTRTLLVVRRGCRPTFDFRDHCDTLRVRSRHVRKEADNVRNR